MVLVPERSYGVFFGGDCYIVLYTYQQNGKDKYIIYFWQVPVYIQAEHTRNLLVLYSLILQLRFRIVGSLLKLVDNYK